MKDDDVIVVYDGECPFCRNYCRLIRLKASAGSIKLIDARMPSPIMVEITALNLDIDQGMVVKIEDQIYCGSDAINVLSLMSSKSNFFNRITFVIFSSRKVSSILYPFLRACRNFALWLLNIPKIKNLQNGTAR